MYDIAIIGLGPAGATLARLLDSTFKIIVIDKKSSDPNIGFSKPCGGLLATNAQKALSRFDLTLPKSVLVDPQIFSVKTIDLRQNLIRHYQRFYINLDRRKFDDWLISLIPSTVEIIEQARCSKIKKSEQGYEISYIKNNVENNISSRIIIGADGSNSFVRKSLFPRKKIRRYLSIQHWFSAQKVKPFYCCIFDSQITDSYCWSVSKDGFYILGGAFPAKNANKSFELLKEKLKTKGYDLDSPAKVEACMVSMPRRPSDFYTGKDGAFLIGEAAGFISPSSLEGISYALDSAFILAKVLNSRHNNPNRRYKHKTRKIRLSLLLKCIKVPLMYRPLLRKLVMKSGLCSIDKIDC